MHHERVVVNQATGGIQIAAARFGTEELGWTVLDSMTDNRPVRIAVVTRITETIGGY